MNKQTTPNQRRRAVPIIVAALIGFAAGSLRQAWADDGSGGRVVHALERIASALEKCPR